MRLVRGRGRALAAKADARSASDYAAADGGGGPDGGDLAGVASVVRDLVPPGEVSQTAVYLREASFL